MHDSNEQQGLHNLGAFRDTADLRGIAVDLRGIAVDFRGIAVDFRGIAVDLRGIAVDFRGIAGYANLVVRFRHVRHVCMTQTNNKVSII